ncbi:MAG: hypothetical protein HQK83_17900 [Fibrobacteria bacterium]|nr:hypothetical protein [Fibrobacteria bacterium]
MFYFRTFVLIFIMVVGTGLSHGQSDEFSGLLKQLKGGYVQPVATLLGSLFNSGWYQSASVNRGFGFAIGLPISVAYISSADHTYTNREASGCAESRAMQTTIECPAPDYLEYEVPTIFGPQTNVQYKTYHLDTPGSPSGSVQSTPASSGYSEIRDYTTIPFLIPHLAFSWMHTEIKARYLYFPLDFIKLNGNVIGMGVQHDISWLAKNLPFSISAGTNVSLLSLAVGTEDFDGTMDLKGFVTNTSLLLGKQWGPFELFLESGWETSSLTASGTLVEKDNPDEVINPNIDVSGRNGFRLGLNVALHLGYHPVIGQNIGAQIGHQANLLFFKKEAK